MNANSGLDLNIGTPITRLINMNLSRTWMFTRHSSYVSRGLQRWFVIDHHFLTHVVPNLYAYLTQKKKL